MKRSQELALQKNDFYSVVKGLSTFFMDDNLGW